MPEVTRRRLLSSAAAGAGGVLATSLLPPALARAAGEGTRRGSLKDVKHVVIHMQENRSFDHYFGTLGGVAGFGDPNALIQTDPTPPFNTVQGKSIFYQYEPAGTGPGQNPDGYLLPWHLDTKSTSCAGDSVDLPRLVLPARRAEHHGSDGGGPADHGVQQQLAARSPHAPTATPTARTRWVTTSARTSRSTSRSPRRSRCATTTTARCSARRGRTACT